MKTRAEESNRLGKDFQVELGPNQGTHIAPKVGDLDNISLAGFRTCYRPTIATWLPLLPYLNGSMYWGYPVPVSPFDARCIFSVPRSLSKDTFPPIKEWNLILSTPFFESELALWLVLTNNVAEVKWIKKACSFALALLEHCCRYIICQGITSRGSTWKGTNCCPHQQPQVIARYLSNILNHAAPVKLPADWSHMSDSSNSIQNQTVQLSLGQITEQ